MAGRKLLVYMIQTNIWLLLSRRLCRSLAPQEPSLNSAPVIYLRKGQSSNDSMKCTGKFTEIEIYFYRYHGHKGKDWEPIRLVSNSCSVDGLLCVTKDTDEGIGVITVKKFNPDKHANYYKCEVDGTNKTTFVWKVSLVDENRVKVKFHNGSKIDTYTWSDLDKYRNIGQNDDLFIRVRCGASRNRLDDRFHSGTPFQKKALIGRASDEQWIDMYVPRDVEVKIWEGMYFCVAHANGVKDTHTLVIRKVQVDLQVYTAASNKSAIGK